jgi:hypothetical protein
VGADYLHVKHQYWSTWMAMNEEGNKLLAELRDLQQKLLDEYSRVANEALSIQRESSEAQKKAIAQQAQAVEMQRKSARLYRLVVLVAAPVLAFLVWEVLRLAP